MKLQDLRLALRCAKKAKNKVYVYYLTQEGDNIPAITTTISIGNGLKKTVRIVSDALPGDASILWVPVATLEFQREFPE